MGKWVQISPKFKKILLNQKLSLATFFLISISLILILSFNNCGGVNLQQPPVQIGSIHGDSASTFPIPFSQEKQYRIVFFVDMSLSMQDGLCPNDEAANSNDLKQKCTTFGTRDGAGADPDRYRLDVIKKWITTINDQLTKSGNSHSVKYLLVPFTGGIAEQNRKDNLNFVYAEDTAQGPGALSIIDGLDKEQQNISQITEDINQEMQQEGIPTSVKDLTMGTSAPWNRLDAMEKVINTEITNLSAESYDTAFEIVYLSDGIPTPLNSQIKKTVRDIWGLSSTMGGCITDCGAVADAYVDGVASQRQVESCSTYYSGVDGYQHQVNCMTDPVLSSAYGIANQFGLSGQSMLSFMAKQWGDYMPNTPNQILLKISEIKNLIRSYTGVDSRMSFVLINPLDLSPDVSNDSANWIIRAKTHKVGDRYGYLTEDAPPFSLIGIGDNLEAYKIGSIFILNPYVRVNNQGNIIVDSSANGASDQDQIAAGFDPSNPRSNGLCLNSLAMKGLCPKTLSCDPHLDSDGDGLNECEEIILGTDPNNFDSDGDSIPDSLEYLYGHNPLVNDLTQFSNGSGSSDFDNFKLGLPPLLNPNLINSSYLSNYTVKFIDYVEQATGVPKTGRYQVNINNLPTASVRASSGWDLYFTRDHNPNNKVPINLVGGAHVANVTPVIVLVRVDNNLNNGEVHWGYELVNLNALDSSQSIQIDLSQLKYFKANNPQGVQ